MDSAVSWRSDRQNSRTDGTWMDVEFRQSLKKSDIPELQGSSEAGECVGEQKGHKSGFKMCGECLFHMREINAILRLCRVLGNV